MKKLIPFVFIFSLVLYVVAMVVYFIYLGVR